jgi:hypothetical protein
MNTSAAIGLGAAAAIVLIGAAALSAIITRGMPYRRRRPKRSAVTIEILTPAPGDGVPLKSKVIGTVRPDNTPVQILVAHGDGRWYPEAAVAPDGSAWTVDCTFGTPVTPKGQSMRLVAIAGANPVQGAVEALPPGTAASAVVEIHRARDG